MTIRDAKLVARLAVSRYHVDARLVRQVLSQAIASHLKSGQALDLVNQLVRAKLLNTQQAQQIHNSLRQTHHDGTALAGTTAKSKALPPSNGANGLLTQTTPPDVGGYRLLRKLGEGTMGEVYLAQDDATGKQFAIKILSVEMANKPTLLERFHREAEHAGKLDHAHLVRAFDAGYDLATGRHYLLMEYVDGPSAQKLVDQLGRLTIGDGLRIALDIAAALEHAHSRNIIHRDIKPENILITRSGVAKLADLGLAKELNQSSNLTKTRHGFGTPYYMPYEQAISARTADARADIFALGATLYHLLTGEVPFPGETALEITEKKDVGIFAPASSLNPEVTEELDRILAKALARVPADRYQMASEFIVDVERTGLARPVLSFVDQELALAGAAVRERKAVNQQATQMDVGAAPPKRKAKAPSWHLRFRDAKTGKVRSAMASTAQVVRAVERQHVPAEALASRSRKGPFLPLANFTEFQKLLPPRKETAEATAEPAAPTKRREPLWRYVLLGAFVALLALVLGYVFAP
jgi:serine/threonine-protein kinase